jgi:outer membrane receptor for ferrienterochelin and colicin
MGDSPEPKYDYAELEFKRKQLDEKSYLFGFTTAIDYGHSIYQKQQEETKNSSQEESIPSRTASEEGPSTDSAHSVLKRTATDQDKPNVHPIEQVFIRSADFNRSNLTDV